jgi:pyrimidine operon attenuation protein / uracil phosphoribosyltransferase
LSNFTLDAERLYAELRDKLTDFLRGRDHAQLAIVGITSGGAWLAERLHRDLGIATPLGIVSSALHRDDYATKGVASASSQTKLPFEVDGRDIVLIDDVLHTGRTIRAVINELFDFGRPARISLAVLVDRGARDIPIAADVMAASTTLPPDQVLALYKDADASGVERFYFRLERI